MSNLHSAAQAYRTNQVNSATPLDLVLMAFDAALIGCNLRDLERTSKALSVLRNALDFSYDEEFAMGMLRLYQYFGDLARSGDYELAAELIGELRSTWSQAKENLEGAQRQAVAANAPPAPSNRIPGPAMGAYSQVGVRGQTLMTVL
jgi:flagellin-specific chaperone FliS